MSEPLAVPTANSSTFLNNVYWCPADLLTETGAVIIDRSTGSERVLLVRDDTLAMYTLPRSSLTGMDDLMESALRAAESKSGLQCERLLLPRMGKYTVVPPDGNWDNAEARAVYVRNETTTNPFVVLFDTAWRQSSEGRWAHGFQLITFWFTGFIKAGLTEQSSLPAPLVESQEPPYLLLSIPDALRRLEDKDKPAWKALLQFDRIWKEVKDMDKSIPTAPVQ